MDKLHIYYQNMGGIKTKTQDVLCKIINSDYDIIVIVESWLQDDIKDGEFIDDRYNVFRRDRNLEFHKKEDGGGVLIAVHKKYKCYRMKSYESTCEDLWVNIVMGNSKDASVLSICGVYLPSPLKFSVLETFINNTSTVLNINPQALIIGDFNLTKLNWSNNGPNDYVVPISCNGKLRSCINDFMCEFNMYQMNGIQNRYGKILDLVLYYEQQGAEIVECSNPLSVVDRHHPPLEIIIYPNRSVEYLQTLDVTKFNFFKADYEQINFALEQVVWDDLFKNCSNVDDMLKLFYHEIQIIIEKFVPKSRHKSKNFPCWYSKSLIRQLNEKNKYRIRFKKYKNPLDEVWFQLLRDECEELINYCYKRHIQNIENSIRNNPKFFFSYLKKVRNNKSDYPAIMHLNGETFTDTRDVCNAFAKNFSSVYGVNGANADNRYVDDSNNSVIPISTFVISDSEISKKLRNLDQNKGAGPDNIHPVFAKKCATTLAKPLGLLFNRSLSSGHFPNTWKMTRVVPVFKDNDKSDITKYRPISILSVFPKVFESLICPIINWHMKPLFTESQHGFLRNRSTMSNLALYVNDLSVKIDNNIQVDSIYTDFSKAFDRVDHTVLISKLKSFGFGGKFLEWLYSYLKNRPMKVVIAGAESDEFTADTGVPQGSHLGPLLFNIFINDVTKCFHNSKHLMYADDLKIYKEIRNADDCQQLQNDLMRLVEWCDTNKMSLNINKCYQISITKKDIPTVFNYSINSIHLNKVADIRDLGVIVDSKLSFLPHTDKIIKQALKMSGLITRMTRDFKTSDTRLTLFNSFSRSILEYGSVVWNPYYKVHENRIERVQKKFLRHVTFKDRALKSHPSYNRQLKKYKILSLSDRRSMLDMCFLHNIVNSQIDSPLMLQSINLIVPQIHNRRKNFGHFKTLPSRTNVGISAPLNRFVKTYNEIASKTDLDIYHDSLVVFKRKIKKYFLNAIK